MADSKKIDDGGYAFPCGPDDKSGWHAEYGMTLRQHYAGVALAALIQGYGPTNDPDEVVHEAICYADLLIAGLKAGSAAKDDVIESILAERSKQISAGFDAAHDDEHQNGEIIERAWGAMGRIHMAFGARHQGDVEAYKRRLTQAAAMIVAELKRVTRSEGRS